MSVFDSFLNTMKMPADDEDIDYEEDMEEETEEEEEEEEEKKPARRQVQRKQRKQRREVVEDEEEDEPAPARPARPQPASRPNRSNLTPMRSASRNGMEVCLIKPTSFNDGREICDTLINGRSVVLNLEGLPTDVAQRIIDFTSGACYSMDGNLQKISNYIVIVTPRSVDLTGDFGTGFGLADGGIDISNSK